MSTPTALDLAIHRTFHNWQGGLRAAAAALGVPEQVLRNKAAWNVTNNHVKLFEARDAMLISGDLQILEALCNELGVRILGKAEKHAALMQELMTCAAEGGDVARVMADALRDGVITPREQADIAKEVREEIAARQRMLSAIEEIVAAGGRVSHG